MPAPPAEQFLALAAAVAVLVLLAPVLRPRNGVPTPEIAVTPIASAAGAAIRVTLTNRGTRAIHAPMVTLRPAPPGVRRGFVARVVPPSAARTPLPVRALAPGASEHVDLPCPLQPGETYARVLGLAPGEDDEVVYGLPIETLLAIDIEWRTEPFAWWRPRHRAMLVRGAWLRSDRA